MELFSIRIQRTFQLVSTDIQCIQRTADQSSGNETGEMGSIEGAIQNTSHQG